MTARRSLTTAKRVGVFMAAGGICHICGGKITGKEWDVEHVIPLALGGADDESNMKPAHKVCHAPKTKSDVASIAKAKRMEARRLGIKKRSTFPCSRTSKWKAKIGGGVVLR